MGRFRVALDLDEAALVGRCLAYVADPRPDRSRHRELFTLLAALERFGLGPPAELLDALPSRAAAAAFALQTGIA